MNKDIQTIGSNPAGIKSRLAGKLMNFIHSNQYKAILKKYIIPRVDTTNNIVILDVGCGGGKLVQLFYSMLEKSRVEAIDHSNDMVQLSKKVNNRGIRGGRVNILQGSADRLPYYDLSFDLVTAFDTINFWNDVINPLMKSNEF